MGASARLLARLLCLGGAAHALAARANIANILDVSWSADVTHGTATFEVQALQPAGCVPLAAQGRRSLTLSDPLCASGRLR